MAAAADDHAGTLDQAEKPPSPEQPPSPVKSILKPEGGDAKGSAVNISWNDFHGKELTQVVEFEPRYAAS